MPKLPRASRVKITRADGTVEYQQPRGRRVSIGSSLARHVFARDGLRCRYCGFRRNDPTRFEIDHVIPVSEGGRDILSNLVVACVRCNKLKGTQTWVPIPLKELDRFTRPLTVQHVLRRQGWTTEAATERARVQRDWENGQRWAKRRAQNSQERLLPYQRVTE